MMRFEKRVYVLSSVKGIRRALALFLMLCFGTLSLLCQEDSSALINFQGFLENLSVFHRLYPQEKVYVHPDNTGYYLGETIWFKAYVVNAGDHHATAASGVLYIELLNSRGTLLETKKLKIVDGQCQGDFFLSPFNYDYHAGFYEIRAYTKMMLNFGADCIFSRVFPVFNAPEQKREYSMDIKEGKDVKRLHLSRERPQVKPGKKINIDFFPEGGNLLEGVSTRVAFKATDEYGCGIAVERELLNDRNEPVTRFTTVHGGMGSYIYSGWY